MIDTIYEFISYIYRVYGGSIRINLSDSYVDILVYTRCLSFNVFIPQFRQKFDVIFSE